MDGRIDEEQWLGAEGEEQVDREEIPRWMRERVAAARRMPRN